MITYGEGLKDLSNILYFVLKPFKKKEDFSIKKTIMIIKMISAQHSSNNGKN